jgi:putative transposase
MRGPQPPAVVLSDRLRGVLEHLARRQTSPQRLVRRLQIVLAAAGGRNNDQIARHLDLHRATAQAWRTRWLGIAPRLEAAVAAGDDDRLLARLVADALDDTPRAGAPPTFTAEQVVQLVALACEPPPGSDRPVSHWTPRELADEAVKRGIVSTISPRSVGRFLGSGRPPTASEPVLVDPRPD